MDRVGFHDSDESENEDEEPQKKDTEGAKLPISGSSSLGVTPVPSITKGSYADTTTRQRQIEKEKNLIDADDEDKSKESDIDNDIATDTDSDTEEDRLSYESMVRISKQCNKDNTKILPYFSDAPYGLVISAFGQAFFDIHKLPINRGEAEIAHMLKFHVSLPEYDYLVDPNKDKASRKFYKKGWNIIKDILMRHKVEHFKIADDTNILSEGGGAQRGKDITIYAFENKNYTSEQWYKILYEITEALVEAHIPPGYKALTTGDRAVKLLSGNYYVSYKYDAEKPKRDEWEADRDWPPGQLANLKWDNGDQEEAEDDSDNDLNNPACGPCKCNIL